MGRKRIASPLSALSTILCRQLKKTRSDRYFILGSTKFALFFVSQICNKIYVLLVLDFATAFVVVVVDDVDVLLLLVCHK